MQKLAGWCFFCVGIFVLASVVISHALTMIVPNQWRWSEFVWEMFSVFSSGVFFYWWHSSIYCRRSASSAPTKDASRTLYCAEPERRGTLYP